MADFLAPDAGTGRTPYCCTYHWFRLADGRMVNVDVVRSDDKGRDVLRVFVADEDGGIRGMVVEAPQTDWAAFCCSRSTPSPEAQGRSSTARAPAALQQNALVRAPNYIAAHARGDGSHGLHEASFALDVRPLVDGRGPGHSLLWLAELSVVDYTRVRYTGTITLDGTTYAVDSVGPASVHAGARLCEYAYVATVPPVGDAPGPSLLLAAVRRDDFKYGGALVGDNSVLYAYGDGGVPGTALTFGPFGVPVDLGGGARLELDDTSCVPHTFLDAPDGTATALATVKWRYGDVEQTTRLGRVVLDFRGSHYVGFLDGP